MIDSIKKKDLEKQGYRIVGNHSAIKVCEWTKKAIRHRRDSDVCYKCTFYGINSHRCVQMTPALPFCTHRCVFCWRDIDFTKTKWQGKADEPKAIVDGCVKQHTRHLLGFGGLKQKDSKRYLESMKPKHFAISLSGEPTLYPKLGGLIEEINKRGMTSFLVTNGINPAALKKLLAKNQQPTQLYITLPAPDEETYKKVCRPLIKDGWKKIMQSLTMMKKFRRNVIRMTLVKDLNMIKPEKYAEIIKKSQPQFVELKAYMWVGYSKQRLGMESMPLYPDIMEFAKQISELTGYKIIDEKKESRVVLLMKEDFEGRKMLF